VPCASIHPEPGYRSRKQSYPMCRMSPNSINASVDRDTREEMMCDAGDRSGRIVSSQNAKVGARTRAV
jgi:hypothetical protein